MKPVVILDANPLFGLATLSSANFKKLLALAKTGDVRLVIPDVVVQELARQAAKDFNDRCSALRDAVTRFNRISGAASEIGLVFTPSVAHVVGASSTDRATLYDALSAFLRGMNVESPTYPDVSVEDLLARDLDYRKPFNENGKGFRDALIWETIRELCRGLAGLEAQVVFVTKNHTDFCGGKDKALHPHLRDEISADQCFDIVEDIPALLDHKAVKPLTERLQVVNEWLTQGKMLRLVDRALTDLSGLDLVQTVGVYDGDGNYISPIRTVLDDVAFNDVAPDNSTVTFEAFRTSDSGDMTVRATVEADCEIEGLIDKGDFLARESDFTYAEDWNRHMMRVIESHRVRFTLSADFTAATLEEILLSIDEIEDVPTHELAGERFA
ncbi:PIN domain-containing protein [Pseudarthrobacter sp. MDT3-28]|uniref:PIN domain-containing protein n=1 Tax=Pseudarthrobacter raffinosi TaxID=2953651 RepID=UPI00208F25EE|nr:PIN domain-containing protein [Pseudarthrobacter sp. MDT3-28]MCO4237998.1 PIN domain-containing protein [Pseudarthrobacter sp. MDT3-28]